MFVKMRMSALTICGSLLVGTLMVQPAVSQVNSSDASNDNARASNNDDLVEAVWSLGNPTGWQMFSHAGPVFVAALISLLIAWSQIYQNRKHFEKKTQIERDHFEMVRRQTQEQIEQNQKQFDLQMEKHEQNVREQISASQNHFEKQQHINAIKHELDDVTNQLSSFYGPFLAVCKASEERYKAFVEKHQRSPGDFFNKNARGEEAKLSRGNFDVVEAWKSEMKNVFVRFNETQENLVLNHMGVVDDEEFCNMLVELITHTSEFRSVMQSWTDDTKKTMEDFEIKGEFEFRAEAPYPHNLATRAQQKVDALKRGRDDLLKQLKDAAG